MFGKVRMNDLHWEGIRVQKTIIIATFQAQATRFQKAINKGFELTDQSSSWQYTKIDYL